MRTSIGIKVLISIAAVMIIFLLVGQTYSVIDYDWAVSVGLQESEEEVTKVGIAWLKAFAVGDTLSLIPFLVAGIIGLTKRKRWGLYTMFAGLAISVYWPIVNLTAIYIGRQDMELVQEKYISFSILLPLIMVYGLWGMWYLYRNKDFLVNQKIET